MCELSTQESVSECNMQERLQKICTRVFEAAVAVHSHLHLDFIVWIDAYSSICMFTCLNTSPHDISMFTNPLLTCWKRKVLLVSVACMGFAMVILDPVGDINLIMVT